MPLVSTSVVPPLSSPYIVAAQAGEDSLLRHSNVCTTRGSRAAKREWERHTRGGAGFRSSTDILTNRRHLLLMMQFVNMQSPRRHCCDIDGNSRHRTMRIRIRRCGNSETISI
ncbi:hypothetical protein SASPL_136659 [Salvia splendens]|uniref:Uncharacterized protein n=1 Tax=Salvia splendens TaxID=180675 RepID=A0A8X8ZH31_SALSN|nr:hypothetical protein SASPL_136659 [Salvia splendens]